MHPSPGTLGVDTLAAHACESQNECVHLAQINSRVLKVGFPEHHLETG